MIFNLFSYYFSLNIIKETSIANKICTMLNLLIHPQPFNLSPLFFFFWTNRKYQKLIYHFPFEALFYNVMKFHEPHALLEDCPIIFSHSFKSSNLIHLSSYLALVIWFMRNGQNPFLVFGLNLALVISFLGVAHNLFSI